MDLPPAVARAQRQLLGSRGTCACTLPFTYVCSLRGTFGLCTVGWSQRYKNFWSPDFSWLGLARLIIFPVHDGCSSLQQIRYADFRAHFQMSRDNAWLFVGCKPTALDPLLFDFINPHSIDEKTGKTVRLPHPSSVL